MNKQHVYNSRENLTIGIPFLGFVLLLITDNTRYLVIIALFYGIMAIMGNIRRIPPKSEWLIWIRRNLYLWPFVIPLFLVPDFSTSLFNPERLTTSIAIGGVIFLANIAYQTYASKDVLFEKDLMLIVVQPPASLYALAKTFFSLIGAVFFEELFFRFFIISYLGFTIPSVVFATAIFVAYHFMLKWSQEDYSKKDYLVQAILGASAGLVYWYTKDMTGAFIVHASQNCFNLFITTRRYQLEQAA